MEQMGIFKDEMMEIFQVVAGVLHLGNIMFEDAGGSSGILLAFLFPLALIYLQIEYISLY